MAMFEVSEDAQNNARIMVIGVGGAGGNAVNDMLHLQDVEFAAANTDAQALKKMDANIARIQLGKEVTRGLGAGADPDVGRKSAQEDRETLRGMMEGADMVFITAGMGGGTGTGAAPVIAEIAKSLSILTVAVVTKPFTWEGKNRMSVAEEGIKELSLNVDSLITIPNNKLLKVLGKQISLLEAFKAANQVLQGAVQGVADLITRPGLINVDFADVRTVMSQTGMAMIGRGQSAGEQRAKEAAESAVSSPLLDDIDLKGAKGMLVNITAGYDLSLFEFESVGDVIRGYTSEDATVVVGAVLDPEMADDLSVTVVATGLDYATEVALPKKRVDDQQPYNVSDHVNEEGSVDYEALDRPALLRRKNIDSINTSVDVKAKEPETNHLSEGDESYFDIPTYLRRREATCSDSDSEQESSSTDEHETV
jgi:cell division protein FtsZ